MQRSIARLLIMVFAGLATIVASVSTGNAQCTSPNCFQRIIVPVAAGGATDTFIRLIAEPLGKRLGTSVIIENRPGAGGAIALDAVLKADADGKTLLAIDASTTIAAALRRKIDIAKDLVAVSGIVRLPTVMIVSPSVPAKTLPEFIDFVKKNPGKVPMSSPGTGSLAHLSGELLKSRAGLDTPHVAYQGAAPSIKAVLTGDAGWTFVPVALVLDQIKTGKLRPLAVSTAQPLALLPDVPTVSSIVPGYEASGWVGLSAPKGTKAEDIDRLQKAVKEALSDPDVQKKLAELGGAPFQDPVKDFVQLVANDAEKWSRVGQDANIKID